MIFGGEMSKISIFGGCAMWCFFFAVAREQKIPTSKKSRS